MTIYELAGMLGVAVYLGSYAALQLGLIPGGGYLYAALNLVAAIFVLWSLTQDFNLWSAIIQVSWIVISVVGIARRGWIEARLRFSPEERELVDRHLPHMRRADALRVLRLGRWQDLPAGTRLVQEESPVSTLYVLAAGAAEVCVAGQPVARLGPGDLAGEMGFLDAGRASATVTTLGPVRVFALDAARALPVIRRDPDLRAQLDFAFGRDIRRKLVEMNAARAVS